MNRRQLNRPDLELLAQEHTRLHGLLVGARDALQRRLTASAIGDLLDELSGHIGPHFAHEEEGGFFDEIIATAPHLKSRAESLLAQHAEFLKDMEQMFSRVREVGCSPRWCGDLAEQFEQFACRFLEHERAENALLQQAFNEDIGAPD